MKLNRDISILLMNAIEDKNLRIALPLAGSGVRAVRFLLELDKDQFRGRVSDLPKREELTLPMREHLIVELYSK